MQVMTLPNGDAVAVTKTCTTADPGYPNCLPAAQWGSKTYYYYYPQYATQASADEQLISITECAAV